MRNWTWVRGLGILLAGSSGLSKVLSRGGKERRERELILWNSRGGKPLKGDSLLIFSNRCLVMFFYIYID